MDPSLSSSSKDPKLIETQKRCLQDATQKIPTASVSNIYDKIKHGNDAWTRAIVATNNNTADDNTDTTTNTTNSLTKKLVNLGIIDFILQKLQSCSTSEWEDVVRSMATSSSSSNRGGSGSGGGGGKNNNKNNSRPKNPIDSSSDDVLLLSSPMYWIQLLSNVISMKEQHSTMLQPKVLDKIRIKIAKKIGPLLSSMINGVVVIVRNDGTNENDQDDDDISSSRNSGKRRVLYGKEDFWYQCLCPFTTLIRNLLLVSSSSSSSSSSNSTILPILLSYENGKIRNFLVRMLFIDTNIKASKMMASLPASDADEAEVQDDHDHFELRDELLQVLLDGNTGSLPASNPKAIFDLIQAAAIGAIHELVSVPSDYGIFTAQSKEILQQMANIPAVTKTVLSSCSNSHSSKRNVTTTTTLATGILQVALKPPNNSCGDMTLQDKAKSFECLMYIIRMLFMGLGEKCFFHVNDDHHIDKHGQHLEIELIKIAMLDLNGDLFPGDTNQTVGRGGVGGGGSRSAGSLPLLNSKATGGSLAASITGDHVLYNIYHSLLNQVEDMPGHAEPSDTKLANAINAGLLEVMIDYLQRDPYNQYNIVTTINLIIDTILQPCALMYYTNLALNQRTQYIRPKLDKIRQNPTFVSLWPDCDTIQLLIHTANITQAKDSIGTNEVKISCWGCYKKFPDNVKPQYCSKCNVAKYCS